MSTAIQQYDAGSLTQWRDPEEVLSQAQRAAIALKKVLDLKENKVMFNNEQYLEREDWGTAGRFFGCTAKSIETRYVEFPDGNGGVTRGFEAVAVVIDMNTNYEIGRAESMCLDEEDSWGEVTVYEWKDKLDENGKKIWNPNLRKGKGGYEAEKVQAGKKNKPLFQLRSMAQTRAEAKALKSVFGWFVVLAGYKPTPAEELTGHEDFDRGREQKPSVQQPKRASEKQQAQPAAKPAENGTIKITGKIESLKEGKDGAIWVNMDNKLVVVEGKFADDSMVEGAMLTVKAQKRESKKIEGGFYSVLAVLENPPVVQAETVSEAEPVQELEKSAVPVNDEVKTLFDNGSVKRASEIEAPKTIGKGRAQRLWALMTQNAKTTGLTEEIVYKKILTKLPIPLEHLSDLEFKMKDAFEKIMTGEADWRDLVGEE